MALWKRQMRCMPRSRIDVYNFYFYFFTYMIVIIFACFSVLLIVVIQLVTAPKKTKTISILDFKSRLKDLKDGDSIQKAYEFFGKYFLSAPSDDGYLKDWLDCISELTTSSFMGLDSIMDLRQRLEKTNPANQDEIKNVINLAIKNRSTADVRIKKKG